MRLQASARLLAEEADVSYEDYVKVVASLARPDNQLVAFDFKVPGALKKLWSELKEIGQELTESAGIGWDAIVKAFQEKSVFTLLKGLGFSVKKLLKAVSKASAIPAHALFIALDELIEAFGDSETLKRLNVHERVERLDEVIKRHPVLSKLTGVAVAGFLIWQYLHTSNTGDVHYDLSLVDTILNCIKGDYSLADMFASKQGLKDISVLLFGLASGGMGLTSYGASHVEHALTFLGKHAGTAASILLALFYAGAKKLGMHIDYSHEPVHAGLSVEQGDPAGRTQRWFNQLSGPEREKYRKKYPGTKFNDKTKLILPKA